MSTWTDAVDAIKSRLNTEWAALHSTIPVVWPNDPTQEADPAEGESIVHAEISGASERFAAFGGPGINLYRRDGDLTITIFSPAHSGEETLRDLAADAAAIFRGKTVGSAQFLTVSESGGGAIERDGVWFSITLFAVFYCHFTA